MKEEGNADYGGMVQPDQQNVAPGAGGVGSVDRYLGNDLLDNYLAQLIIFRNLHLYLIFSPPLTNCR